MDEGPAASEQEGESGTGALGQVCVQCWPVLGAIFFSGTFFVLAFPFFPYVPSDGTFGPELPRVSSSRLMNLRHVAVKVSCAVHSRQGQHAVLQLFGPAQALKRCD